jgi:hypothetical protein|tara:strand:- start:2380 stop:2538 length:159 start_codon:yes stop_codon:yes gene_type:complete
MGCGCNGGLSKKEKREQHRASVADRARNTVKRIWNHAQKDQPTHVVKRINKK